MKISISNLGKKYSSEWIFKGINASFETGQTVNVIGSNGSGKSTLLKVLSASELPTNGAIQYESKAVIIKADEIYKKINYCAPYVDLPEELSVREIYDFHHQFKPIKLDFQSFVELIWLQKQIHKSIKHFSSGMKQRLKLALSLLSESEIVFLDEPTSNLDEKGKSLYNELVESQKEQKLIFIGTNSDHTEMKPSNHTLNIMDYKS